MLKTIVNKFGYKRTAAVAILAIGAIGATQVPTHRVSSDSDRVSVATDSEQAVVFGTNNLLGGANADVDGAARAAELSQDHLISCMSLGQTGDNPLLKQLRGLTQASQESQLAVAGIAGTSASSAVTAAVPEPATAGLLAAMVVPALLRRRRSAM